MKKYDVTGIGNALVDIEFEVSDAFLDKFGIEKGLMTLVDEDRQGELMAAINTKTSKLQCGGSAANSIIAVSQFGGKSYYCCKVANDELGKFFTDDLREAGVNHNLDPFQLEEGITGKCLVMVTADAERTMNTFLGITEKFSTSQLNEEAIKASKYLYIEGYLITSPNAKEAMMAAKKIAEENEVKVAITFSDPAMVKYFGEGFQEGKDNVADAAEDLKKIAKHFVITQGKNGALIFDGDTFIDIAPYPTVAVDSNGAGDMFAGAFMYGITNGHSYASSGKLASMASSKIVSQFGPRLTWEEAKAVLERLQP